MAQLGGLEDGKLSSVVPAEASADLAQSVSADPSVESQSAESANAVTADVAANKERISTSGEWPHDKCLDLQIELRARMLEWQARALEAEAKVKQLERDLTAQQKAVPKPEQAAGATDKDVDDESERIVAEIKLLRSDLAASVAEHRSDTQYLQRHLRNAAYRQMGYIVGVD